MGSEYTWHTENRVIYARLFENVTIEDLRKGNAAISEMLAASGTPPVHLIFDTTAVNRVMVTILQVRNELHYIHDPRIGWFVVYGLRGLVEATVQFIVGITSRALGFRVRTVSTFNDARDFLTSMDATLHFDP